MSDLDARRREALADLAMLYGTFIIGRWAEVMASDEEPAEDWQEVAAREAVDLFAPAAERLLADDTAVCTTCQHRGGDDQPAQHPGCAAALGRIRARALREAAEDFATGAWADAWGSDGVDDDVSAVRSTERWLLARADRIGGAR